MHLVAALALEALAVGVAIAQGSHTSTTAPTQPANNGSGCASVSSYLAAQPTPPIVPADIAYQCLQSVPVDVPGDMELIEELKLILQWQSNIAYLKDPPPGSPQPPVDMIGRLDQISGNLATGGHYHSEYEVQL